MVAAQTQIAKKQTRIATGKSYCTQSYNNWSNVTGKK